MERFANAKDFKDSDTAKILAEEYSLRKRREFDWADVLEYECKYKRRVGFVPCPMKMKVSLYYYFKLIFHMQINIQLNYT